MNQLCLNLPDKPYCIHPGDIVKLGRFSNLSWQVCFGWYSWGGNREVCGWYLISDKQEIKPLQKTDLDDIYFLK